MQQQLTPDLLQDVADKLRLSLGPVGLGEAEMRSTIAALQSMRDEMVRTQARLSNKMYAMTTVIESLMFAGMLVSDSGFREALLRGMALSVPDASVRSYYAQLMESGLLRTPSHTTLNRHRLTLHVGFCRYQAQVLSRMLQEPSGVVRWGSIDSSPQGRYDWVSGGFATMLVADLAPRLREAHRLIHESRRQHDSGPGDAQCGLLKSLRDALQFTQLSPVGVGSGRACRAAKAHAVMHSVRMMCETWQQCAVLMCSVVTWTGDLGTESRFPTYCSTLTAAFGEWVRASDSAAEDAMRAADASGAPDVEQDADGCPFDFQPEQVAMRVDIGQNDDSYRVDLRGSVYIAGVLHVLHNCTERLTETMEWWETFVQWLTQVANLLGRDWSRARLLATCFSEWPHRAWQDSFRSFTGHVYEGRWGSVLYCVRQLLPLKLPLVAAWDARKFSFGEQLRDEGEGNQSVRLRVVDQAIQSKLFWGYLEMVDVLGSALRRAGAWAESCPCHWDDKALSAQSYLPRARAFEDGLVWGFRMGFFDRKKKKWYNLRRPRKQKKW